MDIVCGIYKICSPSGRVYIGQSVNIFKRFRAYKNIALRGQTLIANSLRKYGYVNHTFEIIHECSEKELNELEIHYIKIYGSFNPKTGLNLKAGGQNGGACSEATKQKLRKPKTEEAKQKYREAALRRKPISEETREKFRQHMMGNKNLLGNKVALGRKHTDETRVIIKAKRANQVMPKGHKRPDVSERLKVLNKEWRANGVFDKAIEEAGKPIICTMLDGTELNFPSVREAARKLKTCAKGINKHARENTMHKKGWIFKYQ